MSGMYQMMMEGATSSKVEIFKDTNEAQEWIASEA